MPTTRYPFMLSAFCTCALALLTLAALPDQGQAAASAKSTSWGLGTMRPNDSDEEVWRHSTPTPSDTISWTSGPNFTDGTQHMQMTYGPETKFAFPGARGRTFAGAPRRNNGPGACDSKTHTFGVGNSYLRPGALWGTTHVAVWTVTADGTRGNIPPGVRAYSFRQWDAEMRGADPYTITRALLAESGLDDAYSLLFGVGLEQAEFSQHGTVGMTVVYEDAGGEFTPLRLVMTRAGAVVSSEPGFFIGEVALYRLAGPEPEAEELRGPPTTLGEIRHLLQPHAERGRLDEPLSLAIILRNVPIPEQDLDTDGVVARIHIVTDVADGVLGPGVALPE